MAAAVWPVLPNKEIEQQQTTNKAKTQRQESKEQPQTAGEEKGQQEEHPQQHPSLRGTCNENLRKRVVHPARI